jgi:hypothetical protein
MRTPKNWSRVSLGHPKFGTGCPLEIWLGCQIYGLNGNKFATGQILRKPVEVVEGADLSWLSSKVSRTLDLTSSQNSPHFLQCNLLH